MPRLHAGDPIGRNRSHLPAGRGRGEHPAGDPASPARVAGRLARPGLFAVAAVLLMAAFVHWYLFRHLDPLRGQAPVAPAPPAADLADARPDDPAALRAHALPEARAWRPWLARRSATFLRARLSPSLRAEPVADAPEGPVLR